MGTGIATHAMIPISIASHIRRHNVTAPSRKLDRPETDRTHTHTRNGHSVGCKRATLAKRRLVLLAIKSTNLFVLYSVFPVGFRAATEKFQF